MALDPQARTARRPEPRAADVAPASGRAPRLPRFRWLALVAMLLVLGLALTVNGFASQAMGGSATGHPSASVPGLGTQGPVVDLSGPEPRSAPLPDKTVALTFDDGPDPRWTPAILDVLRRHDVPATFFVVGGQAAKHPELVRAEVASGHEIGAHTFSHSDLGAASPLRATIELSLSQSALAGAAGVNTHLLRLPYSSRTDDVTSPELTAARRVADLGYLMVFATEDGEDWRQPGAGTIVARSTPPADRGGIVLLHDGGGDRRQTVEALDRLIVKLKGQGYRFTTVSDIAGLTPGTAVRPVGSLARVQGRALLLALWLAAAITKALLFLILPLTVLTLARSVAVVVLARRQVRETRPAPPPSFFPPVSVLVPAYNEEVGIAAAVRSLADNDYPTLEIIVVDDGSTDGTAAVVEAIDDPRVRLIRQTNGGKPAALNTGIAAARARHHRHGRRRHRSSSPTPSAIWWHPWPTPGWGPWPATPRSGTGEGSSAAGSTSSTSSASTSTGACTRSSAACPRCREPSAPSAAKPWPRWAASATTRWPRTPTSPWPSTGRAGRSSSRTGPGPGPRRRPRSGQLWRQRYRWSLRNDAGDVETPGRRSPSGSALGLVGLPSILFTPGDAPAAVAGLRRLRPLRAAVPRPRPDHGLLARRSTLCSWPSPAYAFRLDGESPRPLWALPLQQFVYRQLMYLVVIESLVSALAGTRLRWHKLTRTGDLVVATGVANIDPRAA